ncbi:helix-turn-helix domain-containing protein [Actinophytocola sediminis]
MSTALPNAGRPAFYTVREAAEILRCNKNTLYRAIHEGAFPAVRIRSRFVVPAEAVERFAREAVESGTCVDVAGLTAEHRTTRELAEVRGGLSW